MIMANILSTVPSLSPNQLRNIRRNLQRERKKQKDLKAKLSTMGPIFYDPNIIENEGFQGTCSVCGKSTCNEFNFVVMCSKKCQEEYMRQWEQFGLNLGMGANILFDEKKLKFCTWRLEKNDAGEPCLIVYDPDLEDEYNKAPEILVPLSARQHIKQI